LCLLDAIEEIWRTMNNKEKPWKTQSPTGHWWAYTTKESFNQRIFRRVVDHCCSHLPQPLKSVILILLASLGLWVLRVAMMLNQFALPIVLLQGQERTSKEPLSIFYIGDETSIPFLTSLLYHDYPKISPVGQVHLWSTQRTLRNPTHNIDAVILKCDRFYAGYLKKQGFIIIPEWITMTLETSSSFSVLHQNFSKSAKEDIRKIKKQGYTYEVTHDLDKLHLFYYDMYLPYADWRYGSSAVCTSYSAIRLLFEKDNILLLIKQNNEYVCGSLFSVKKDSIIATYAGIRKGYYDEVKKGLGAAPYYFLILWAKKHNINTINFGKCRPFLRDGNFQYKKKWGTIVHPSTSTYDGIFALQPKSSSQAIRQVLVNNPFISTDNSKLKGQIYCEQNKPLPPDIQHFLKKQSIKGLEKIQHVSLEDMFTKNHRKDTP
jgi:hypothetical protein